VVPEVGHEDAALCVHRNVTGLPEARRGRFAVVGAPGPAAGERAYGAGARVDGTGPVVVKVSLEEVTRRGVDVYAVRLRCTWRQR